MPLSFNAEPYFSFTQGMMSLDPAAFSTRWYQDIMLFGMNDPNRVDGWWSDMWNNATWVKAAFNSSRYYYPRVPDALDWMSFDLYPDWFSFGGVRDFHR